MRFLMIEVPTLLPAYSTQSRQSVGSFGMQYLRELQSAGKLFYINVQRFRGWLVSQALRLRVSLNSKLESNKQEEEVL